MLVKPFMDKILKNNCSKINRRFEKIKRRSPSSGNKVDYCDNIGYLAAVADKGLPVVVFALNLIVEFENLYSPLESIREKQM